MIKAGVDLRGLQPQMAIAYTIASAIYLERAGLHCYITSASDGKHGPNSLHYKGMALDLRTRSLRSEQVAPIYKAIKEALGEQFDVVLEQDHIHLEFQPKEAPKVEA
jgi:hypothetical protein